MPWDDLKHRENGVTADLSFPYPDLRFFDFRFVKRAVIRD